MLHPSGKQEPISFHFPINHDQNQLSCPRFFHTCICSSNLLYLRCNQIIDCNLALSAIKNSVQSSYGPIQEITKLSCFLCVFSKKEKRNSVLKEFEFYYYKAIKFGRSSRALNSCICFLRQVRCRLPSLMNFSQFVMLLYNFPLTF